MGSRLALRQSVIARPGPKRPSESRPALRLPFVLGLIGGGFPLRPLGGFQALL